MAINKCCQNSKTFSEICIASRTKSKCDDLKEKLEKTTETKITTAQVDADNVDELIALIKDYQPDAVLNVALPYQDLTIMDACLACKVDYIDTANYEPEDTDDPQWRAIYEKRCKDEDLRHILIIPGSGLIRIDLKKPVLQHFWAVVLTLGLQASSQPMR